MHPDPLETLYAFPVAEDREVAAWIAAAMAYGRVRQILQSLDRIFAVTGPHPAVYLRETDHGKILSDLDGFVHRFANANRTAAFLSGTGSVCRRYGSLRAAFARKDTGGDILDGLEGLVSAVREAAPVNPGHLLPNPKGGSAAKRMHLFLRWLVRCDAVDPGGWEDVGAERLLVPVDTHMHRIGQLLGLTRRKTADLKTAVEITRGFAEISPEDPVRYDFALTRLGIRDEGDPEGFLEACLKDPDACFLPPEIR